MRTNWLRSKSGLHVVFGSLVGAFAIHGVMAACGSFQVVPDAGVDSASADAVPVGETPGMIAMFNDSCPVGWVVCDGGGLCPDFRGAYIKAGTAYEPRTGSNTHSHTISGLTAAMAGGHSHTASVSIPSAGGHSHIAYIDWGGGQMRGQFALTTAWNATHQIDLAGGTGSTAADGGGVNTTTAGAHTHAGSTVSVATAADHTHALSATIDNASHEPEHVTLVLCMKAP
jgi:hypothetical protein